MQLADFGRGSKLSWIPGHLRWEWTTARSCCRALDRLTSETAPDGAQTAHAWDAVGNRLRVTSPAGTTYYTYDPVGRLSSIRSATSDGSPLCYFEFDRDAAGDIPKSSDRDPRRSCRG